MSNIYDHEKLKVKWDIILKSSQILGNITKYVDDFVIFLEEGLKQQTIIKGVATSEVEMSPNNLALPMIIQSLSKLIGDGTIVKFKEGRCLEYDVINIEWSTQIAIDLGIFNDPYEELYNLILSKICDYYKSKGSGLTLPYGPMIIGYNIEIKPYKMRNDFTGFDLFVLRPT